MSSPLTNPELHPSLHPQDRLLRAQRFGTEQHLDACVKRAVVSISQHGQCELRSHVLLHWMKELRGAQGLTEG